MMRFIPVFLLALGLTLSSSVRAAAAEKTPVVISDLLRLRNVTHIDVSRDGGRAVFVVQSIAEKPRDAKPENADNDPRQEWEYRSHLFLLDTADADAAPRQLTFSRARDHSPVLSPDGRRLAFVREPVVDRPAPAHNGKDRPEEQPQIWVMSLDGGEARVVTHLQHGASAPFWSPNGRSLLFSGEVDAGDLTGTPTWPLERPKRTWNDDADDGPASVDGSRAELRRWLASNAEQDNPTVITRLDFQGEQSLKKAMRFKQLWAVDPDEPSPAPRRLTNAFCDHESAAFVPDGSSIVYVAKKPADMHPDRVRQTDLWQVNVDGSNDRLLLRLDGWELDQPRPSRDGSVIAFTGKQTDEPTYRQTRLGMVALPRTGQPNPADPASVIWLTGDENADFAVRNFHWMASRSSIVFTTARRGSFPLMTISPGLIAPAVLVEERDGLPVGVHAMAAGGAVVVYAMTTASNPCVLMLSDARGERMVMDLNPWVQDRLLSTPRGSWLKRPDGRDIQYWIMPPVAKKERTKYPLVLNMHGGPAVMWGPGEATMWHEFQMLCGRGMGLVYANPRGSSGYGYAFQRANFQDWGEGPAGDVLACVDQAMLQDWVDDQRLVITGGSYAGYLTAWIITQDHRFKAAVAQRGVYDLATFFGEGNAWRLLEFNFGGWPFEARSRDVIARNSPFNAVQRVRTPLLIMHASNDLRTGVSQSEMFYRALKALGKDVEYIRYPSAGHDLSRTGDPRQRMDRLGRIAEFFDRYVGPF